VPRRHHLPYCHTVCSPQGGCFLSAWTTPRHHSLGQYIQAPARAWSGHWPSCATQRRGSKLSRRQSVQVFPRYVGLDAWDLGSTPSPLSSNSWRRNGTDASTPLGQTPTLSLIAMTLRGSASTSMGPWLPQTTRRTPPPVHKLPQ